MKKILFLILAIASFWVDASAQTPSDPTQINNTNYYLYKKFLGADSAFLIPQRDTAWLPSRPALVYQPTDSALYYWNWSKWIRIGQSDTSADLGIYLLKTDFIDSLNNNRQTLSRVGDSAYLTFGGSISIAPDSVKYATRYWVSTQGYITEEVDPVFTSSAAYNITQSDVNAWQGAFNQASLSADTLVLTAVTGGVTKLKLQVSQDTSNFHGTGAGFGLIKTGSAKVYGDTLSYDLDTTKISYPTSVHDSVEAYGLRHSVTITPTTTISVSGGNTQNVGNNPSFSLNANNTQALWNASQLQGASIGNVSPTNGQVLYFNGTSWVPYSLTGSGTVTSVGIDSVWGIKFTSNTTNPITTSGVFVPELDTSKVSSLQALKDTAAGIRADFPSGGSYINNQTTQQPSSNFNISGNGIVGGYLSVRGDSVNIPAITKSWGAAGSDMIRTTTNLDMTNSQATTFGSSGTSVGGLFSGTEIKTAFDVTTEGHANISGLNGAMYLNADGTGIKFNTVDVPLSGVSGSVAAFGNSNYSLVSALTARAFYTFGTGGYTAFTGHIDTASQLYLQGDLGSSGIDANIGDAYGIYQASTYHNKFSGGIMMPIVTETGASVSVTTAMYTIVCTNAAPTVTLPDANSCIGQIFKIINQGSGAMTLSPSFVKYDGTTETNVPTGTAIIVQSDGVNYQQIP